MLRLTLTSSTPTRRTIAAEGRLIGDWGMLLEQECNRLLAEAPEVELRLGGVSDVDSVGIAALRRLRERPVTLTGLTPILRSLLDEEFTS